jgi:hypothetical protein
MGPSICSQIETLARRLLPRHRANPPGQPRRVAGTFSFWHSPETGVTIGKKTSFRSMHSAQQAHCGSPVASTSGWWRLSFAIDRRARSDQDYDLIQVTCHSPTSVNRCQSPSISDSFSIPRLFHPGISDCPPGRASSLSAIPVGPCGRSLPLPGTVASCSLSPSSLPVSLRFAPVRRRLLRRPVPAIACRPLPSRFAILSGDEHRLPFPGPPCARPSPKHEAPFSARKHPKPK